MKTIRQIRIDSEKRIARLEVLVKLREEIFDFDLKGANQVVGLINQWEKRHEEDLPINCSPMHTILDKLTKSSDEAETK